MAKCLLLCALVALSAFVVVQAETDIVPWGMVNLDKNTAIYNSLYCLDNFTAACPPNYLNESGLITVATADQEKFCSTECQAQLTSQLDCINKTTNYGTVARFRFNNNALVTDVMAAATAGCTSGNFTYKPSASAAGRLGGASSLFLLIGALASLVLFV